ncbi:MAG: ABC transporter substrate-binding protein/permease [Bacilli bacterium]|nr:ABC transporter substrate-binding protein/permease [Bacilli bacterium]
MRKQKFIVCYLVIFLMSFFISGCSSQEKEELTLVTEAGFAPYEYYSNGEIVGVDIEIAQKIAKNLGKKLVIKDVAFDSIINEVKTKKSDIGAAGISYTEERAREVAFTDNYSVSKQVIIVNKNSYITSKENLVGKVAVQLGTTADTYLTKSTGITLVREKKFLAAIQDLKDGKVNAVVMDELPAKKLITSDMKILSEPLVTDSYGMVVAKENTELLESCNKVIKQMKESGEIDKILLKHMGQSDEIEEKTSVFDRFYQSVIYDNRYQYILEGLKNTLIIAVGAVILGILLGTLLAFIRHYHDETGYLKVFNAISKAYIHIIRGTPSILQLMIIYYVIFKNVSISIVLVGILAFGINSAAYVAEIIRAGLNSVDKGQIEAGYALSLNYRQVMMKIVFPQAIRNILPALGNEFITLVKETSVGAYIGIVELTKASDIIASRTYDYFFPLILIAVIYFAITFSLSKLISIMEKRLNYVRN